MADLERRQQLAGSVERTARAALWTARGAALVLLGLGIYIWTGNADELITLHIVVGVVLVLSLWTLAAIAARAGVSSLLIGVSIAWSFAAALLGLTQENLLTGEWHWTVQALHLVIAMAMVGWCQALAVMADRTAKTRG